MVVAIKKFLNSILYTPFPAVLGVALCFIVVLLSRWHPDRHPWLLWSSLVIALLLAALPRRVHLREGADNTVQTISSETVPHNYHAFTLLFSIAAVAIVSVVREFQIFTNWIALALTIILALGLSLRALGWPRGFLRNLAAGDWIAIAFLVGIALALYFQLAPSWKFALIGDERAFFESANYLISSKFANVDPFEASGVYGDHPVGITIWQAFVMNILGGGAVPWKFSCALLTAITIPLIYSSVRVMLRSRPVNETRLTAILVCLMYAFSELITDWSVIGKAHISFIVPLAFTVYCLAHYHAERSASWCFLVGASAGAGIYLSIFGAGVAILVGTASVFLSGLVFEKGYREKYIFPLLAIAGFLVFALPILVQFDAFQSLFSKNIADQKSLPEYVRTFEKTFLTASLFVRSNVSTHFLFGNLIDPIAGAIILYGFLSVLWFDARLALQLFLLTLLVALVTGGVGQYGYPSPTRTLLMMLPLALSGAMGIAHLVHHSRIMALVTSGLVILSCGYNLSKLTDYNPYQRMVEDCNFLPQRVQMLPANVDHYFVFPSGEDPWLFRSQAELLGYSDRVHILHDSEEDLKVFTKKLHEPGHISAVSLRNPISRSDKFEGVAKETGATLLPSFARYETPRYIEPDTKSMGALRQMFLYLVYETENRPFRGFEPVY